uniref:Uncharacterized protein n=1 Tax=Anguilla anguilla TaxID=7936 RepID=A0A0E9WWP1_ANGAN
MKSHCNLSFSGTLHFSPKMHNGHKINLMFKKLFFNFFCLSSV